PGTLADGPERDFAKPPDFAQRGGNLAGRCAEDSTWAALDETSPVVEARDLVRHLILSVDPPANRAAALGQQPPTEQRRSTPRMQAPGRVEQPAVPPFDTRRNDLCAIRTRQALERPLPRAVNERAVFPAVTDFAGREDDERTATMEPEVRSTQSGA